MGVNTRSSRTSNSTYLKLGDGKITREWAEEPKAEWVPDGLELKTRTITKGKNEGAKRWYVEYEDVDGTLLNVELKKFDKVNIIEVYLQDGIDTYIISIPEESAYGKDFMMAMNNIDFSKVLVIAPWSMTPEEWLKLTGKKRAANKVGLTLYSGSKSKENKVLKYYTKEEPNGLPPLVQKEKKGEITWDSDDQDNFLFKELTDWIEEAKKKLGGASSTSNDVKDIIDISVPPVSVADLDEDFDEDDLPF